MSWKLSQKDAEKVDLFRVRIFSKDTAQKMKFSIKDFFSKCDQIRSLQSLIWLHILK